MDKTRRRIVIDVLVRRRAAGLVPIAPAGRKRGPRQTVTTAPIDDQAGTPADGLPGDGFELPPVVPRHREHEPAHDTPLDELFDASDVDEEDLGNG